MDEIWGCFKYVGIPYDSIWKMPLRTRRYFIQRHNESVKKEMEAMKNKGKGGHAGQKTSDPSMLNKMAAQNQMSNMQAMMGG